MVTFVLTTLPGLEAICAADAVDLGARQAVRLAPGYVRVEADAAFTWRANHAHPTAMRVLRFVGEGVADSLATLTRSAADVAWENHFDVTTAFAAAVTRLGEQPYRTLEAAAAIGMGVSARFHQAAGAWPRVDLKASPIVVRVLIVDEVAHFLVDLTGRRGLDKRAWRVADHPAPLASILASAMVRQAAWPNNGRAGVDGVRGATIGTSSGGLLLDPLCGSATILIEADHRARQRAVNLGRREFAFTHHLAHASEQAMDAWQAARDRLACNTSDRAGALMGNERDPARHAGALRNAAAAHLDPRRTAWRCGDFATLTRTDIGSDLDAVVTNPPWGHRMTSKKVSNRIFLQLQQQLDRWQPRRAVILVGDERFENLAPHREPTEVNVVRYGTTACRLVTYEWP